MDTAECFIELENKTTVEFPFGDIEYIETRNIETQVTKGAGSIFRDTSDYPVYHVNKENKTIGEVAANYQKQKNSFMGRLKSFLGIEMMPKEYKAYKVEYREYKAKHIQNKTIVDFLWFSDDMEKGYFELDNGYIITETTHAMNGTGAAGLTYFEKIDNFIERKGKDFLRLTDNLKGSS